MFYIEISTIDSDKYHVEGQTQEEIQTLFWQLMDEINRQAFLAMEMKVSDSLFAIRVKDIKQLLVIGEDDLPLSQKPNFVRLLIRGEMSNVR